MSIKNIVYLSATLELKTTRLSQQHGLSQGHLNILFYRIAIGQKSNGEILTCSTSGIFGILDIVITITKGLALMSLILLRLHTTILLLGFSPSTNLLVSSLILMLSLINKVRKTVISSSSLRHHIMATLAQNEFAKN